MDSILEKLTALVQDGQHRPTTPAVRDSLKLRIIDTVGCGISGSVAKPVVEACEVVTKLGGSGGPCTVFGRGKAPVDRAAFLNGFMQRYLDFNDSYLGKSDICHPSDIIAAGLAVGEAEHRSGEELLRALATGYNGYCSLIDAVSLYKRGWDIGWGPVGVALECAVLLKLDEAQTRNAISLAVIPQNPLRQTRQGDLSHWKGAAFSNCAANTVLTTYLAAGGMTGPDQPFEGKYGMIPIVSGPIPLEIDHARDTTGLSDIKLRPLGHHAQGPVELAIDLRRKLGNFAPKDAAAVLRAVDEIDLKTYSAALIALCDTPAKWTPTTRETADHSIPFLFGLALAYGEVDEHAIYEGIKDKAVFEITSKLKASEDPDHTRRYPPEAPVSARIKGPQGTVEGELSAPLGNVTRPVPLARILQKFHVNADPVIGPERAKALEKRLLEIEKLPDVAGLLEI